MNAITLKKEFYARDRYRDHDDDSFFKHVHKNISFLSNTGFVILLAPTVVISSLMSHTAILMVANAFLALGFIFNFAHRVYLQEASPFELLVSLIVIGLLVLLAFYLAQPTIELSLLSILGMINLVASGINSFFLIRHVLIPPLASMTEYSLRAMGFDVSIKFHKIHPLTIEQDKLVIDRLLNKLFKINSDSPAYTAKHLESLNRIIDVISRYINKYQAPLFGSITNSDFIKKYEDGLSRFVKEGYSDTVMDLINRKISFKASKIRILTNAKLEVGTEISENSFPSNNMHCFFSSLPEDSTPLNVGQQCLQLLDDEIQKQQTKLDDLYACQQHLLSP